MTFKLRKGARFQNIDTVNGREITSEEIKYSLERAAYDPSSLFQATYRNVERFEAPDKYTFVIRMKSFDAEFLRLLSGVHGWVVPKEVVRKYGNLKTVLIGSGPFIFDKWAKDVVIVLKRNPDYYIKGLPYVDEFHYLFIRDAQTRNTAFRTGRTDYPNVNRVEFNDTMGTNPERCKGQSPRSLALSREEQKRFWPHDPGQAKMLLEEAGFKEGLTLELLYARGRIIEHRNVNRHVSHFPDTI